MPVKRSKPKGKPKPATKRPAVRASGMVERRPDLGMAVGIYFARLTAPQRKIAVTLDAAIRSAVPSVSAAMKWGMPVYEHHGMLCYIRARPAYVTLGFYGQGTTLDDPKGLLKGSGQTMRHIKCPLGETPDSKYLTGLVRQAARFNEAG